MNSTIIGCDPGIRGGLAVLKAHHPDCHSAAISLTLHRMPTMKGRGTRRVVDPAALRQIIRPTGATELVIEDVHSMPTDGVVQAFQFGENTGVVKGVAAGCGLTISEVSPQTWKRVFGLTSDKGASIHRAGRLCPSAIPAMGVHDGLAEAFLIALWGVLRAGMKPLSISYAGP